MDDFASVIEGSIAGGRRDVERAIFGTVDAASIAHAVDDHCRRHLGQGIVGYRFYRSSIASVHGVELADGRRVVVKAHQPTLPRGHLEAVVVVQRHLAAGGFPCPRPLSGPLALGLGHATVEEELMRGGWHDGHDPAYRAAMARSLAELVDRCRSLPAVEGLLRDRLLSLPPGELWIVPHAAMFDFEATAVGAEAIDEVAAAARSVFDNPGRDGEVLGHTDWRAENLRFDGQHVSSVYDWESLVRTTEPVLVGGVAHAFCSDWAHSPSGTQAPALDEARAFVSEYGDASGAVFDRADRRRMGAAYAYATAYTARCGHSVDPDGATEPGQGFRILIREHGGALVDAFLAG